jgi:hypothetical protein
MATSDMDNLGGEPAEEAPPEWLDESTDWTMHPMPDLDSFLSSAELDKKTRKLTKTPAVLSIHDVYVGYDSLMGFP